MRSIGARSKQPPDVDEDPVSETLNSALRAFTRLWRITPRDPRRAVITRRCASNGTCKQDAAQRTRDARWADTARRCRRHRSASCARPSRATARRYAPCPSGQASGGRRNREDAERPSGSTAAHKASPSFAGNGSGSPPSADTLITPRRSPNTMPLSPQLMPNGDPVIHSGISAPPLVATFFSVPPASVPA